MIQVKSSKNRGKFTGTLLKNTNFSSVKKPSGFASCSKDRGIILDSSQAPAPAPIRGEVHAREGQKEPNAFPFPPSNLHTSSPEYLSVMCQKAHLVVRMLENKIGAEQLLQVLNKQLALATTGSQQKWQNRQGWANMIISTVNFNRSIFLVTGKDTNTFMDQWVRMHSPI